MKLPHDLKHYKGDAFDLGFSPEQIVLALCILIALGAIFS